MIRALTAAAILASFVFAVPAHAEQKIKPEMTIQFTKGTIACLSVTLRSGPRVIDLWCAF
jgi:hypothetical protein